MPLAAKAYIALLVVSIIITLTEQWWNKDNKDR